MKNIATILIIIVIVIAGIGIFLLSSDVSYAQAGGLVPCDGPECGMCHIVLLVENIINFIIQISFIVVAILFAYAGFLYFTGGTDPGKISSAKNIFTNAFIGIIIILTAWLVVNVILVTLTGDSVDSFTSILQGVSCDNQVPTFQSDVLNSGGVQKSAGTVEI